MKFHAPVGLNGINIGGEQFDVDGNGDITVPDNGYYSDMLSKLGFVPFGSPAMPRLTNANYVVDANNILVGLYGPDGSIILLGGNVSFQRDASGNVIGLLDGGMAVGILRDSLGNMITQPLGISTVSSAKLNSPREIAGLTYWFDAQDSLYTASYAKVCDTLGDAVTIWPNVAMDSTTESLTPSGTTPTFDPTGINGHPAVYFGGAGYYTLASAIDSAYNNAMTVFIVAKANTLTGNPVLLSAQPTTNNFWIQVLAAGPALTVSQTNCTPTSRTLSLQGTALDGIAVYSCGASGATPDPAGVGLVAGFAGPYINSYQPATGAPGASATTMQGALTAGGLGFGAASTLNIGALYGGSSKLTGWVGEVIVVNAAMSLTDIERVKDYLYHKWYGTLSSNICCIGDSLTSGTGSTTGATQNIVATGDNYPCLMWAALGSGYTVYTDAYPGRYISSILSQMGAYSSVRRMPASATNNISVVWAGTNTLAPTQSVSATYEQLMRLCQIKRALGDKVVVLNCLPRQDAGLYAGFESARLKLNARIAANYTDFADALVEVASIAALQDPTNTTYFHTDKLHLTSAGYALVASLVASTVAAL